MTSESSFNGNALNTARNFLGLSRLELGPGTTKSVPFIAVQFGKFARIRTNKTLETGTMWQE
jgi:hypothetical protein